LVTCPTDAPNCCPATVGAPCFVYTKTPALQGLIDSCPGVADVQELAEKTLNCCLQDSNICSKAGSSDLVGVIGARPGYNNNCSDNYCIARVNWPECSPNSADPLCCDNLTNVECAGFIRDFEDGVFARCSTIGNNYCPDDIAPPVPGDPASEFKYEFVAKSNEKVMVIYQIKASPDSDYTGPPGYADIAQNVSYFYTLVKIFDVTNAGTGIGTEVYPNSIESGIQTIINQKAFTGEFSIFSAIAADKDSAGKSIFKQGHKYRIKLYYLLAPLDYYTITTTIKYLQFTILRIRE